MLKKLFNENKFLLTGIIVFIIILIAPINILASNNTPLSIAGIRIEFILFGLTLTGVALFHKHAMASAITGLVLIIIYKIIFVNDFPFAEHFFGNNSIIDQLIHKEHRQGEWGMLINLAGLLFGFAILAKIFEESQIPDILPKFLPNDWRGPFVLLIFVFVLSSFLDNIAAAIIGGTIAVVVFNNNVHIGYLAAIVASSNAGGAGSVVGDTTTTMMWISGVSAFDVLHAFIASAVAMLFFAWFASRQQDKYQRIQKDIIGEKHIGWSSFLIIILILSGAIISNILYDMPALGVWIVLFISSIFKKIPWGELKTSLYGTVFLLCLVTSASLMPVETLPDAHWATAFILGFISSVFDNIPLTKLCLEQGHYDWGILAYTVGFGGSMVWFGSSAGVALTNKFQNARNIFAWVKSGWHIIVAYILGFFFLLYIAGWHPSDTSKHKEPAINCPVENCKIKTDLLNQIKN